MKLQGRTVWQIVFLILVASIATVILFFASGCEVLKSKHYRAADSTSVHTSDSTAVSKGGEKNKMDSSWWREIINYLPQSKGKDTIINNTTVPVNNYYPAQIIREGGSISKEWLQWYIDSVNEAKKDTTSVQTVDQSSSKEKKVLTIWQIVGICFGVSLVTLLISKLKISFKT